MRRVRLFTPVAAAASAAALALSLAAPAHAESTPETAGETVSFGLFATGTERPEGSFDIERLEEFGVEGSDVELLAEGVVPETGSETSAQQDDVLNRWDDVDGWEIIWREGRYDPVSGSGSGALKIDQKHNLSMEAVRATTQYPYTSTSFPDDTKFQETAGGTSYRYQTEVWEVECSGWLWWRECEIVDTRVVRALVDFRIPSHSPEPVGAFNAYCEQNTGDRCPDWVREALNI